MKGSRCIAGFLLSRRRVTAKVPGDLHFLPLFAARRWRHRPVTDRVTVPGVTGFTPLQ
jgi:hypothetical protein